MSLESTSHEVEKKNLGLSPAPDPGGGYNSNYFLEHRSWTGLEPQRLSAALSRVAYLLGDTLC